MKIFVIFNVTLHTVVGQSTFIRIRSQITVFPSNITQSVELINLKGNLIQRIVSTDLSTYGSLVTLNLNSNLIEYLENGCFHNNSRLKYLYLNSNKLTHFPMSWGPLEASLIRLTLSGSLTENMTNFDLRSFKSMYWIASRRNNFEQMGLDIMLRLPTLTNAIGLDACSIDRFPDFNTYIPTIKMIGLSQNKLTNLSTDDLKDLSELRSLNLGHNNIHTMPDLFNISSLKSLSLMGNPLVCNHAMCWVIMWPYMRPPGLTLDGATCQSPPELQGLLLTDVHPLNIKCYESKYSYKQWR